MAEEPVDRLPLIPDNVVDKIRKGQDVPIESLVSEQSLAAAAEAKSKRAEPVHAEALTPISKVEAAQRRTITKAGLPSMPATRRVIPKPFQRHVINLSLPWEPRPEWHYVRADQVQEGDIVPDVGKVVSVVAVTRYAEAADVVPIHREAQEHDGTVVPAIDIAFGTEEERKLAQDYLSQAVAVGTDIILTGPAGNSLTADPGAQVRVFRVPAEESGEQQEAR